MVVSWGRHVTTAKFATLQARTSQLAPSALGQGQQDLYQLLARVAGGPAICVSYKHVSLTALLGLRVEAEAADRTTSPL